MTNGRLLWADDEMELLKAHLLFLEKKGYEVVTVTNGTDAIEECTNGSFDLVLLDEMMPGLSGLETLQRIKEIAPQTPVVMVTKSEEEDIMNQAIGQQIADYLIKPVNPNQILLTLKKTIHRKESSSSSSSPCRLWTVAHGPTGPMSTSGWCAGSWNSRLPTRR